jgi:hypothetical protein
MNSEQTPPLTFWEFLMCLGLGTFCAGLLLDGSWWVLALGYLSFAAGYVVPAPSMKPECYASWPFIRYVTICLGIVLLPLVLLACLVNSVGDAPNADRPEAAADRKPPAQENQRTAPAPKLYINWPFLQDAAFHLAFVFIPFFWLGYVLYALYLLIFVPSDDDLSQPQAGRRLLSVEEAQAKADEIARTGKVPSK